MSLLEKLLAEDSDSNSPFKQDMQLEAAKNRILAERGIRQQLEYDTDKEKMISDPSIRNSILAHVARSAMPANKAAKLPQNASFERALLNIDEDDPRREMYTKLASDLPNVLSNTPSGTNPGLTIANEIQRREKEIKPKIFEYIRNQRSSFFGKEPAPVDGYEEWERKHPETSSPVSNFLFGAGMQGAAEFLKSYGSSAVAGGTVPKFAKAALNVGKILSFLPTTPTPMGIAGKLASAGLMTVGGMFIADKLKTKMVESGAVELSENPIKRIGQELAFGAPGFLAAPKIAGYGIGKIHGAVKGALSKESFNFSKAIEQGFEGFAGKPKDVQYEKDLAALHDYKVEQEAARTAKLQKLLPEDEDAVLRGELTRDEAIKKRMTINLEEEAATHARQIEDLISEAQKLREADSTLTYEQSVELARRRVAPDDVQQLDDIDFLRKKGWDEERIWGATPQERYAMRDAYERVGPMLPAVVKDFKNMMPVPVVHKLTDPIIRNQPIEMGVGNYKPNVIVQPIKNATERAQEMLAKTYDDEIPFAVKQGMPDNLAIDENASSIFKAFKTDLTAPSASSVISTVTKTGAVKTVPKIVPKVPAKVLTALEEHANLIAQTRAAGEAIAKGSTSNKEKFTALGKLYSNSMREVDLISAKHKLGNNEGVAYKRAIKRLNQDLEGLVGDTTAAEKIAKDELDDMVGGLTTSTSAKSNLSKAAKAAATEQQKKAEWNTITGGGKVTKEDLIANKNGIQEKIMAWQKKWKGQMVGAAVAAPALVALSSILPSDADAAPFNGRYIAPALAEVIKMSDNPIDKMAAKMIAAGHGSPVLSEDKQQIKYMMKGYSFAPDDVTIFPQSKVHSIIDKILSPHTRGELHFNARDKKTGARLPYNPAVEIADRSQVAAANTQAALTAVKEILKANGIGDNLDDIIRDTTPLLQKYHQTINLEAPYYKAKIAMFDDVLAGKYKSAADSKLASLSKNIRMVGKKNLSRLDDEDRAMIDILTKEKEKFSKSLADLQPTIDNFAVEYEKTMKDVARKYSTARVALAADGTGMSADNPWLANLLTPNERTAVEKITDINRVFAVRMEEVGHKTLSGPYMHHARHPLADFSKDFEHLANLNGGNADEAMRMVNFYHRQSGSRLMIPDTAYVMGKYLPDAAKRIEIADFWKMYKPGGWDAVRRQMNAMGGFDGAKKMLDDIRTAFDPADVYPAAKWLNRYTAFEVARLLALSPSVSFKHILKTMGNFAIFPGSTSVEAVGHTPGLWSRQVAQNMVGDAYRGTDRVADLARAYTTQSHIYAAVSDMAPYELPVNVFDKWLTKWNQVGSSFVNGVEMWDRGQTFNSAMIMAAKKGMTPEQARYALMDSVLKVNFLTGPNNPKWLKDPFIRTMMMFQGTPFKILEQRMMMSYQAGKDVKRTLDLLAKLKNDVKIGENNFKWHMLKDELTKSKDIYGTPYTSQFLRQMMVIGGVIYTGNKAFDSDLWGHVVHIPGVQLKEKGIQLGVNPIVSAAYMASKPTPPKEGEAAEDDNWLSRFFSKWMGTSGFPAIARKIARLRDDDIPAIYKEGKLSYLFGVPRLKDSEEE
jgi:hypothetical protein